jgi:hypothetical protein
MKNQYQEILAGTCEQVKSLKGESTEPLDPPTWDSSVLPAVNLPVHVAPLPGENLDSLIYRAVERNALQSASEIMRALGLADGKPLSAERSQQLSASLGGSNAAILPLVPTGIDDNTVALGHHYLRRQHLALSTSRICPLCVAEVGYGKLEWSLAPLPVCEKHGTYLIDSCSCRPGVPLKNSRPRYAQCSCGSDLRHGRTVPASPVEHALAREVGRLFRKEPRRSSPSLAGFATLPSGIQLNELLDLIVVLGNLDGLSGKLSLRMGLPVKRIGPVIGQFEKAARLLSGGPDSLLPFLRKVLGLQHANAAQMGAKLRRILEPVGKYLTPALYQWFLDEPATSPPRPQDLFATDGNLA